MRSHRLSERVAEARGGCRLAMEDDPADFGGVTVPDLGLWRWGDSVPVAVCGCHRATKYEYRCDATGEHVHAARQSGNRPSGRTLRRRSGAWPRYRLCLWPGGRVRRSLAPAARRVAPEAGVL
jgi:hypothetical protein